MSEKPTLPKLTAEQRRGAAGLYERAQEVLASSNYDYAIDLLRKCCLLDPSGLAYRQALRQAQKDKYKDNRRGQRLAMLRSLPSKLRLQSAVARKNYTKALEYGEEVLTRNPWDETAHLVMSEALEALNLLDQALWILDQARKNNPKNIRVTRRLAQVLEKLGNFAQSIRLWEVVRQAKPSDTEAQHKVKDLAASETIARGNYEDAVSGEARSPASGARKNIHKDSGADTNEEQDDKAVQTRPKKSQAEEAAERGAREIAAIEVKIRANPKVAGNYLHLAGIYRRNDQFDKARLVLEQGLVPTNNHFDLASELSDLAIEPFRRNLAVAEVKLAKDPDDPDLRKLRGKLIKEINSRELDFYRQKADRFPTDKGYHFEMGVRLLALDQVDEAIKELQTARADPRHKARALYYLGFCFKQRNNWRLAQRNFEEAMQNLGSGDADMHKELLFQLAHGLAESGDLARAFEVGCELADLDYTYKNIGDLIEEWQRRDASGAG